MNLDFLNDLSITASGNLLTLSRSNSGTKHKLYITGAGLLFFSQPKSCINKERVQKCPLCAVERMLFYNLGDINISGYDLTVGIHYESLYGPFYKIILILKPNSFINANRCSSVLEILHEIKVEDGATLQDIPYNYIVFNNTTRTLFFSEKPRKNKYKHFSTNVIIDTTNIPITPLSGYLSIYRKAKVSSIRGDIYRTGYYIRGNGTTGRCMDFCKVNSEVDYEFPSTLMLHPSDLQYYVEQLNLLFGGDFVKIKSIPINNKKIRLSGGYVDYKENIKVTLSSKLSKGQKYFAVIVLRMNYWVNFDKWVDYIHNNTDKPLWNNLLHCVNKIHCDTNWNISNGRIPSDLIVDIDTYLKRLIEWNCTIQFTKLILK